MNTIVTVPCKTIRAMAREMLKGKYWMTVLIVLCCHIIGQAPAMIASALTKNETILLLVECAAFVVEVSLTLCATRYYMMVFRGQDSSLDNFTEPLVLTWKGVAMELISYIQIFLWSLLFVIPGIICAIKHAQNFYAMLDNPEFGPMECIHRSHELMEGNKWKYVKLMLSFIGWDILASLPLAIYTSLYGPRLEVMYIPENINIEEYWLILREHYERLAAFNSTLIPTILGLLSILVIAYRAIAQAAFYDLASGNLIVQDGSQPVVQGTEY